MTNMVRWNPAREMMTLRGEMDRLFDDFFGTPGARQQQGMVAWGIPVDVRENQDSYTIEAMIPGMNADDIDISITDNVLTISAQTNSDQTRDDERYHIRERRFGSFSRTITLPQGINPDQVKADYENGILKLQVPKSEEAKPRRISVSSRAGSQGQPTIEGKATPPREQTMAGQTSGGHNGGQQSQRG